MASPVDTAASAVAAAMSAASSAALPPASPLMIVAATWSFENYLVLLALGGVLVTVVIAALVVVLGKDNVDIETRKVRFAGATFTGILILVVFTAVLYFADSGGPRGKEIFEKVLTAMTPLAGAIIGYLFGSRQSPSADRQAEAGGSMGSKGESVGGDNQHR